MDTAAVVEALDADHCIASWNETLLQIWRKATKDAAMLEASRITTDFVERAASRGPMTWLSIIERGSDLPSALGRAELARISRELLTRMKVAVAVTEGGGFRSATVRGVGTALTALMPHRLPIKFVDGVDQAMVFLTPHLPAAAGGAAGLRKAVDDLRAQIDKAYPIR